MRRFIPVRFILALILVLLVYLFYSLPTVLGYLGNLFTPLKLPDAFGEVFRYMESQGNDFKYLALPRYTGSGTTWAKNKRFTLPQLFQMSRIPTYNLYVIPLNNYYFFIRDGILSGEIRRLGQYLSFLNVRYLLAHDDQVEDRSVIQDFSTAEAPKFFHNLAQQQDLEKLKTVDFLTLYENKSLSPPIKSLDNLLLVIGGLDAFSITDILPGLDLTQTGLIFLDQGGFQNYLSKLSPLVKGILLVNKQELDLIGSLIEPRYLVRPFDYTLTENLKKSWARASVSGGTEYQAYLKEREIKNWDLDYGAGVVFTDTAFKIKKLPARKKIQKFAFQNNNISLFDSLHPEELNLILKDNTLVGILKQGSSPGWKVASTANIKVGANSGYEISLDLSAEAANNISAKVVFFSRDNRELGSQLVRGGKSGNFPLERWKAELITPKETENLQIQIWALQNSNTQSRWFLKNLSLADLSDQIVPNEFEIPFQTGSEEEFVFLARFLRNHQGGKIKIALENNEYLINTKSAHNNFIWQELGKLRLRKGTHKIKLTNLEGFNEVNVFAVVPVSQFQNYRVQAADILAKFPTIFLYSPSSDNKDYGEISSEEISYTFPLKEKESYLLNMATISQEPVQLNIIGENFNQSLDLKPGVKTNLLGPILFEQGNNELRLNSSTQPILDRKSLADWKSLSNFVNLSFNPASSSLNGIVLRGNSPFWMVAASPQFPVEGGKEYQISFLMSAENARFVHTKIRFWDENGSEINYPVLDTPSQPNFQVREVEKLINVPLRAMSASVQIWSLQNLAQDSTWKIEDFRLEKKEALAKIIGLVVVPETTAKLLESLSKAASRSDITVIPGKTKDQMSLVIQGERSKPFLLSYAVSYTPFWQIEARGQKIDPFPVYSLVNGYLIEPGVEELKLSFILQRQFRLGWTVTSISLLVTALTLIIRIVWKKIKQ